MSLMADPPGADRLSLRLRQNLPAVTRRDEFVDALSAGKLPWEAYADFAAQHWFVYESLELATSTMVDDPVARAFIFPELLRLPALEADLRFLRGPRWSERIAALPATTTYCTRVRDAAYAGPIGFIAHHYTRYLGDLTAGASLGRAVTRAYGLSDEGHRFFAFPEVDPGALTTYYRRLLDTLPWSRSEQDAFLTEVTDAHRLSHAVLHELHRRWA